MIIKKIKETPLSINIQGENIEQVEQFVYLGGLINADGSNEKDIQRTVGRTSQAFGMMTRIWKSKELTKKPKIKIYETMLQPIFCTDRNVGQCENWMRKGSLQQK